MPIFMQRCLANSFQNRSSNLTMLLIGGARVVRHQRRSALKEQVKPPAPKLAASLL